MDYHTFRARKGLRTFDPYGQVGLLPLTRQTPSKTSLQIANDYNILDRKIFCHICGRRIHNHGYTGITSDGSLLLFGSKCATDYFDAEALKLAENAFAKREYEAESEYRVKRIKGTAKAIEEWLNRNSSLLVNICRSWRILFSNHKATLEEIFNHLEKNHYRLTEDYEQEASLISRSVGRNQKMVSKKIIYALRNYTNPKTLNEIGDHIRIVEALPPILFDLPESATTKQIQELDEKLRTNFLRSVGALEAAIHLSVEFFNEPAFSQICNWSDRQRILRLRREKEIVKRDLASVLRKSVGIGYETPKPMLSEVLGSDAFLVETIEEMEKSNSSSKTPKR